MTTQNASSVLVVDDDVDNRGNLADILRDMGYHVDTAHDGVAGLRMARTRRYDVALLDYKMPGITGLELYRQLKEIRAGTVALLVSAYTDQATRDAALDAGVWKVLPKPVDLPRLLGLVDEAVGQPLVLIVDDDSELCTNLWQILRECGFRVCLASDAHTAVASLRNDGYKAVLVDLCLPDADGTTVIDAAHEASPDPRLVLITGQPSLTPLLEESLKRGVDAVFHKPLDLARLIETLDRLARPQSQELHSLS